MRPSFTLLRMGYPKSEKREALFDSLGWSDIARNEAYKDTCAIRMSIALSRAGVALASGTMKVQAGRLKGARIETRQRALSEMLKRLWGDPEVYRTEKDATEAIGKRSGVISFFRIGGGPGGHIDLIYPGPFGFAECARSCFFGCREVWFWPLN